MLYKGADLIRDVEFVIFDEVHYVNDAEVCQVTSSKRMRLTKHSEGLCGRRSLSCYLITSTSFFSPQRYQIQRNLQTGLGELRLQYLA
jgi:hypothetical protein